MPNEITQVATQLITAGDPPVRLCYIIVFPDVQANPPGFHLLKQTVATHASLAKNRPGQSKRGHPAQPYLL